MKKAITDMLTGAMSQGINPLEIKKLKDMLMMGENKPTKKYLTKAQRVTRRKIQKASRRKNRGKNQSKRAVKANGHRCGLT